jgi:hypothetical protein
MGFGEHSLTFQSDDESWALLGLCHERHPFDTVPGEANLVSVVHREAGILRG